MRADRLLTIVLLLQTHHQLTSRVVSVSKQEKTFG